MIRAFLSPRHNLRDAILQGNDATAGTCASGSLNMSGKGHPHTSGFTAGWRTLALAH
jgi:hypothetical protein